MKKYILFLIVIICISLCKNVMAQSNTQITTDELRNLFLNGKFKKAISYIEQFKNTKDGEALIILGDCCWKESNIEETNSNTTYQQTQALQSLAISQGLDFDNPYALFFYQQAQYAVLQLRLQTVELYSRASQLGCADGTQRLIDFNSVFGNKNVPNNLPTYGGSTSPQYNNNQFNSNYQKPTSKCSLCNGTGSVDSYVATYGNTSQKWCADCGKMMSAGHCHGCKVCSSCNGKGSR